MYYQFFIKTRTKNVLFFAKQTGSCKGKGYSLVKREQLGSRLGFIMLSAGCAIGCGNVWKFPWMCGQNGGGSFMLVYILCLILLGIPALVLEFSIGRAAQASPLFMYKKLEKPGQKWGIFGWFCLLDYLLFLPIPHREPCEPRLRCHDILTIGQCAVPADYIGCCVLYSFLQFAGRSGTCHKIYDVCPSGADARAGST